MCVRRYAKYFTRFVPFHPPHSPKSYPQFIDDKGTWLRYVLNVMKPVSEKLASGSLDPEYTLTNTMVFAGLAKDEMITDPIRYEAKSGMC